METFKRLPQDIGQYISYCPETGTLRWIHSSKHGNRVKGEPWGTLNHRSGYIYRGFKYGRYLAHRVAWLLGTGEDPGDKTVDHKNGNRADNRLKNLRLATRKDQSFNGGRLGYWHESKRNKFCVQIKVDGKKKHIGIYDCPLLARIAYHDEAIKMLEDIPFVPRGAIKGNPTITNKGND